MPGSGGKHRVRQATKAAVGRVGTPTLLSSSVASAKNVGAGTKGPTARTLRVPLTELLRGGDVASTLLLLLLLALTAASAAPLRSATPTAAATPASASSAATSTTTTTAATTPASTAATSTPTPATTSTSTPTPSAASTTASTAPPGPTGSLAPFALARAASPGRGRRHSDRLKTNEVGRSGRGDRGQERGRRTPLKGGAVTTVVASLSFTLDSGTSQCFFRDHTTITPPSAPVPVALADPTSGPVVARSSNTLPCSAVPSGFFTGLYIPSFSRNLVGVGYLQDRGITVTFPVHGRTAIYTDSSTGAVLATFTREPHSGLFVLHTPPLQLSAFGQVALSPLVAESSQVIASPPVAVSGQVAVSVQVVVSGLVVVSCSCRSLAHPTVLWHHRLGHPSLPCLHDMANHSLVSGLTRVFSLLPRSLAPPCAPCVAGHLRATPHSSSLRPATAPFQTLHLDIWGPAPMQGSGRER
ncbi:unnamed protein product [Closterium sp. NIES-53]